MGIEKDGRRQLKERKTQNKQQHRILSESIYTTEGSHVPRKRRGRERCKVVKRSVRKLKRKKGHSYKYQKKCGNLIVERILNHNRSSTSGRRSREKQEYKTMKTPIYKKMVATQMAVMNIRERKVNLEAMKRLSIKVHVIAIWDT